MARKKSIQIRLDEKLKKRAEQVFAAIGIDTPTAIRIFFTKVVTNGGIPFILSQNEDHYADEQIAYLDRLADEARAGKNLSPAFDSADDLIASLRS
ncbi:MAG: type II toxin-antitoxin system RelB/DinJ family antitoxin [Candidatus Peribacter sp.]